MLIEVAKKKQNAGALAAANTDIAGFEEAVRAIYNWRFVPQHELRGTLSNFLVDHMTNRIPPPIVMTSYQMAEKIEAIDAEGEFWIRNHERDIWMSFVAEDDKKMPIAGEDLASNDASGYETPKNLDESPGRIFEQLDAELELNIHEEPISLTSLDK